MLRSFLFTFFFTLLAQAGPPVFPGYWNGVGQIVDSTGKLCGECSGVSVTSEVVTSPEASGPAQLSVELSYSCLEVGPLFFKMRFEVPLEKAEKEKMIRYSNFELGLSLRAFHKDGPHGVKKMVLRIDLQPLNSPKRTIFSNLTKQ